MSSSLYIGINTLPSQTAAFDRMLRNAVVSNHSKRAYSKALKEFLQLREQNGGPLCRALLMEYRAGMVDAGLSASTINMRLSAIRRFVREARDNGPPDIRRAKLETGAQELEISVPRLAALLAREGTFHQPAHTIRLIAFEGFDESQNILQIELLRAYLVQREDERPRSVLHKLAMVLHKAV